MSIMETADLLLELMFKWISESEACAQQLEKMAVEIESLQQKCNGGDMVGSTVLAVGVLCLLGAGVATFVTGGAAVPFLALAGATCIGVGFTISLASILIEHFSSSNIMKESQKKEQESNNIKKKIEKQFEQLKKELKELGPHVDPDDLDQHVITAFMGAVVGGAVGLIFTLPEAINSWKELIKNNHVTETSKSLRDTANAILEVTRKLKEQLDKIRKELERLADVKWCIENTDRSLEDQRRLIEYAIEYSNDGLVRQWLMDMSAQNVFFGLLDRFNFLIPIQEESREKINDIDVIFVAHGAIEETMISADCLLLLSSINDVVLYSPWNCFLSADAAYGIATGHIQPQHREFLPSSHRPNHLPPNWNSMRRFRGQMIPVITVSSITPDDGACKCFELLQTTHGEPGRNCVVLPFLFPDKVKVPFYIITSALSLVLFFSSIRATVHLAACLGKASSRTHLNVEQLIEQYAYTEDGTVMTTSQVMLEQRFNDLYRALKAVFDKRSAPRS